MRAMEELGVSGIAKVAMREKEHLCLISPYDGMLLLEILHWADELKPYGELKADAAVSDKEMEMAKALIGAMTGPVQMSSYTDGYREAMVELINAKIEGREVTPAQAPKQQEADLVDALMASLKAVKA